MSSIRNYFVKFVKFRGVFFAVAAFIISVLLDIQFSSGVIGFFNIIFLGLFLGIIFLMRGAVARSTRAAKFGIGLILFCALEIIVVNKIANFQKHETIRSAETMIAAIERFHDESGFYPKTLSAMTPRYIDEIPKTRMGWGGSAFRYYSEATEYQLSFEFRMFMTCNYNSRDKTWLCRD